MAGGGIAELTSTTWRLPSVVIGVAALTALSVASALKGWRHREATVGLARRTFGGGWGERIVALFIAVGVVGWSGFYVGVAAGALDLLWGWTPALTGLVLGTGLWALYRTGFRRWNLMVALTGAAAVAVAVLVFLGAESTGAPPPEPVLQGPASVLVGGGLVVSYAAVFALRAPDFTWDAARGSDVVRVGLVMAATLLVFLLLGVGIYARAGSWNLSDLVNRTATPAFGALLLVLSAIAPATSGLHSGALSIRRLVGWSPGAGAAAIAAAGALLGSMRFDLRMIPFLGVLGAVVPPILGVLLVRTDRNRDWHAWVSWAAGSAVSLALLAAGLPAHVLLGIATSAGLLAALGILAPDPTWRSACPTD
jgi:cytosine permease